MRALVTGGTGAVGIAVTRALAADGIVVRVLTRRAPLDGVLPATTEIVVGDVTDPVAVDRATHGGVDIVHHLAGAAHMPSSNTSASIFEEVNVGGTRNVASAALAAGIPRVIVYSTIGVYGPNRSRDILDEMSPPRPLGAYASSKARAEEIAIERLGPGATTIRLAAVVGPHMKANYRSLTRAVAKGRFVPIGSMSNRRTLICESDVGALAVLLSSSHVASGGLFNATDGQVHTLRAIVEAIALAAGRPLPHVQLPLAPVSAFAAAVEVARRLGVPLPPIRALLEKYVEDVAVSGEHLQAVLGFRPTSALPSGFRAAIDADRGLKVRG